MLVINRKNDYRDYMRDYKIILDDELLDTIAVNESKSFSISPGKHTIYLKIDWCKSNKIEFFVNEDKNMEIECGNSMNGFKILFSIIYITIFKNKYLFLKTKK